MMEQAWRDQFQAGYWSSEPASWVPGLPAVSTEMSSCFQTLVQPSTSTSSSSGGQLQQELVEYAAAATPNYGSPIVVFEKSARAFGDDIDMILTKIHRYPRSIVDLDERYTVPLTIAIGPYHHYRCHLQPAEKAKHLAAYRCIKLSRRPVQELYDAVVSVAHVVRLLYHKEAMAGIVDDDFWPMMFYDACFLVQYMLWYVIDDEDEMDTWLLSFFKSNQLDIDNDILLLENQLPWPVVDTLVDLVRPGLVKEFIVCIRVGFRSTKEEFEGQNFAWDGYTPPHLLGLYRYYMVKGSGGYTPTSADKLKKLIGTSFTATKLAEMGVKITPSKTEGYMDLAVQRGPIHGKLCLPPMYLNETAAARLVNMAAFELCTNPDFFDDSGEDEYTYYQNSAVCSYLLLLAMFVEREEDVQELRARDLLTTGDGVGLTNKEALQFFTTVGKHLRKGPCYWDVMIKLSMYDKERLVRVNAHKFFFNHWGKIVTVATTIAGALGLFGTLVSLKKG